MEGCYCLFSVAVIIVHKLSVWAREGTNGVLRRLFHTTIRTRIRNIHSEKSNILTSTITSITALEI